MKFQLSNALAWILVSMAGLAQPSFAQDPANGKQRSITGDLSHKLSANKWGLVKIINVNGVEQVGWPQSSSFGDPSVRLEFDGAGHISGSVCNIISWRYTVLGRDRIEVSQVFMTYMGCPEALMKLESEVASQISSALKAHIDEDHDGAPRLTLRTSNGSRLVFLGRPAKVN